MLFSLAKKPDPHCLRLLGSRRHTVSFEGLQVKDGPCAHKSSMDATDLFLSAAQCTLQRYMPLDIHA